MRNIIRQNIDKKWFKALMIISLAVGFFLILPIMIVILPVVLAYASVELSLIHI